MQSPSNLPLHFHRDRTERELDARLEELLAKLRKNRPSEDPWVVRRAYEIAAERHRDQLRSSGDPYLTHLLEVAHILADMRLDATTLTAALLHDVVEDTEFPLSRIEERFGPEAARLAAGATRCGRAKRSRSDSPSIPKPNASPAKLRIIMRPSRTAWAWATFATTSRIYPSA